MTLLERAGDFYAALVAERKPHDPAVLQFRTFLVQQFQQAGMQIADKVDRARRDGTPIQPILVVGKAVKPLKTSEPAYAKGFKPSADSAAATANDGKAKFRVFEHPAEGSGKPKAPLGSRDMLGKIRGRFQDQPEAPTETELDDEPNTSVQPAISPAGGNTKAASTTKANGGAVAAAGKPASGKFTSGQKEEIASMQPSVVVKHYSKEQIVAFFDTNGVKYNPEASHRQLAATLVGHLKRKG